MGKREKTSKKLSGGRLLRNIRSVAHLHVTRALGPFQGPCTKKCQSFFLFMFSCECQSCQQLNCVVWMGGAELQSPYSSNVLLIMRPSSGCRFQYEGSRIHIYMFADTGCAVAGSDER